MTNKNLAAATLLRIASIASLILTSSLSHAFTTSEAFPLSGEKFSVSVSKDGPSSWNDLPTGAYTLPDSQVIVTKARKISVAEGAFGVLGVLAAGASGKEAGKAVIGDNAASFRIDLFSETERLLAMKFKQNMIPAWVVTAPDGFVLKITPYVFLTPLEQGNARVYSIVKAALFDADGSEKWWTRYIYYAPDVRPVIGENSWSEKDGRHFRNSVSAGLDQALDVMLRDANGAAANWLRKPVKLETMFAGTSELIDVKGEILDESADKIIFSPVQGRGSIIYGINIMQRKEVRLH